jgi:D-3-phosphoglycerate dehydrogenase
MIGAEELRAIKPGGILINNSRGTVVDLDALADALRDSRLLGAAIDVFPVEPSSNNEVFRTPLQNIPNVILTPHVGGSTAEAQERIGEEVARKLIEYSETGTTLGAVNFPQVQLPPRARGARYIHVHRNMPGVLRHIDDVFADRNLNIAAQFLQTDGEIGYVVVDADGDLDDRGVLEALHTIPGTIRARLLSGAR